MKKLQQGRSIIEMLGVLAIIGVLSIGGLAGYTMAMNRHKANQILDYFSRCAVLAQTAGMGNTALPETLDTCAELMPEEDAPSGVTGSLTRTNAGKVTLTPTISDTTLKTAVDARFGTTQGSTPYKDSSGNYVFGDSAPTSGG